jgi:hypothetical protein
MAKLCANRLISELDSGKSCGYVIVFVVLGWCAGARVVQAAEPIPIGSLAIGAPIAELRVTPDGKRGLIRTFATATDRPGDLRLLDFSDPAKPQQDGTVAIDAEQAALGPDGHSALVVSVIERGKPFAPSRYLVQVLDLANPRGTKVAWHSEVTGFRVVIAGDASAFALSQAIVPLDARRRITIHWVATNRADVTTEVPIFLDWAPALLTAGGSFFVKASLDGLELTDLRSSAPVRYAQNSFSMVSKVKCILAVDAAGDVVVEDGRFARFGVYRPLEHLPRGATLAHGGSYCGRVDFDVVAGRMFAWDERKLLQFDVGKATAMATATTWDIPVGVTPVAVTDSRLYGLSGDKSTEVRLFRLDTTAPLAVDWLALSKAYAAIMQWYGSRSAVERSFAHLEAAARLEAAGAAQAVDAPLAGLASQDAATILNDYGYFAAKSADKASVAEAALRRAIALDPERRAAHVNLADFLRERARNTLDSATHAALTSEATDHYRQYLALGGKATSGIQRAVEDPLRGRQGTLCDAIVAYTNAGRLHDLTPDGAQNVAIDGKRLDLVFGTVGTANVPTVYAWDAVTDEPEALASSTIPGGDELWGGDRLGLVAYKAEAALLHSKDDRHPIEAKRLSDGKSCTFSARTIEDLAPIQAEPELCREILASGPPNIVAFGTTPRVSQETALARYQWTTPGSSALLDVANDGSQVEVISLSLASGAGAGCSADFYDVVSKDHTELDMGPLHDLVFKLQQADLTHQFVMAQCGNRARFFRVGSEIYYENRPNDWPPQSTRDEYHRVAKIEKNEVREVCTFVFRTGVVADK